MTQTPDNDHAKLVVTGPELWSAHAVFNANAFPDDLASIVNSCALRAGLMLALSTSLQADIERERQVLESELMADRGGLSDSVVKSEVPIIAYSDGLQYLGTLYSFLSTSKSFLDVYALLMGKCVGRNITWSFKKGRVDTTDLSGGAVVNWLRRSAPRTFTEAANLASSIEVHSRSWITSTVDLRDTITHYSEIPRMKHLCVPLRRMKPIYDVRDFQMPALPSGEDLPAFANRVLGGVRGLVADTVKHLPNVKTELLSPDRLLLAQ